jgi:hypothetical protein
VPVTVFGLQTQSSSLTCGNVSLDFGVHLERMLECDGHFEISGCFRLHSKNLAANAGLCDGVGEGSNSKRHLYRGTLGNQKCTRKQNAPETDVFRTCVQFLAGNLERDRQVQRVANIASLCPLRGIHCLKCVARKEYAEARAADR